MAQETEGERRPRFWIGLVSIIILLLFLYFYRPFESYLVAHIPNIHFDNIVFWFASLVGVAGYIVAHWQSFSRNIFRTDSEIEIEDLLFDTLQIAILIAVIFCAGGTLQAVQMLGEYLVNRGPIIDPAFGEKLLSIILLVILAVLFYLLHHLVRSFRSGWQPRRPPPRVSPPNSSD